jgi:hypothetical protein
MRTFWRVFMRSSPTEFSPPIHGSPRPSSLHLNTPLYLIDPPSLFSRQDGGLTSTRLLRFMPFALVR